jgi:hypothetical protein
MTLLPPVLSPGLMSECSPPAILASRTIAIKHTFWFFISFSLRALNSAPGSLLQQPFGVAVLLYTDTQWTDDLGGEAMAMVERDGAASLKDAPGTAGLHLPPLT